MSSLIPIIADIIPMISPGAVQVTRASELDANTGQTEGMVRKGAVMGKSEKICASVMVSKPHTSSAVHHHGEQDTIIYAASGHGSILSRPDESQPPVRQDLAPGDFAFVPAYAEHQELNDSDEDVVWIITRSGGAPIVVNLESWGGKTV